MRPFGSSPNKAFQLSYVIHSQKSPSYPRDKERYSPAATRRLMFKLTPATTNTARERHQLKRRTLWSHETLLDTYSKAIDR